MKKKHFLKKFFLASISLAGILSVNASAVISDKPNKIKKSSSHIKKTQPQELISNNLETQLQEILGVKPLSLEKFLFKAHSKSFAGRVDQLEKDFNRLISFYFRNNHLKSQNKIQNSPQDLKNTLYDRFGEDLTRIFERFKNNGEKLSKSNEIKEFTEIQNDMQQLFESKEGEDLNLAKKARAITFAADFFRTYMSIILNLGPDLSPQERNLVDNWQKFVFRYFISVMGKEQTTDQGIWRFTYEDYPYKHIGIETIDAEFGEILSKYFNRDQMSMREIREAAAANPHSIVQSILEAFYVFRERMITARNLIDPEQAEENILNDQVQIVGPNEQNLIILENDPDQIVEENGQNQIILESNPDQIIEENGQNQIILQSDPSYDHDYAANNLRTFSDFIMNPNTNYLFGGNNQMVDEDNDMVDENNQNQMNF